ncbi:MAG: hypothetical protein HY080_04470 [Gammaproteobacteria bacterium]|nr:hypothetical protein [Gammaproteobacteria bacterium]
MLASAHRLSIKNSCRGIVAVLALLGVLALSGCKSSSEPPAPTDVTLTAGDGILTVTWTMQPNVQYWLFYAPASSISMDNWTSLPGSTAQMNVTSPYVLTGLTNTTMYALTINGRYDYGPGGPGSPSVAATPRLAGDSWSVGTIAACHPSLPHLHAVTYGTGFVTVGDGGVVCTSNDAKTWIAPAALSGIPLTNPNLFGITYSGQYVAVGASGVILTSPDAATWTDRTHSLYSNNLLAVASNGSGRFVAVGVNGTILTSADSINWSPPTNYTGPNISTVSLNAITYANGQFIVVGSAGIILTSSDGNSWNPATTVPSTSVDLYGIAYGAGTYSAVGYDTNTLTGSVLTSTDASNWALPSSTAPFGGNTLRAVLYATRFIAVGDNGSIYTSPDGANWSPPTNPPSYPTPIPTLYGITHGNYGYSVVGTGGRYLAAY